MFKFFGNNIKIDPRYNEIKYYNYTTTEPIESGEVVGHFTQVVWKNSVKFGVGIATLKSIIPGRYNNSSVYLGLLCFKIVCQSIDVIFKRNSVPVPV